MEARTGPLCDPETGRIEIPSYLAAVCVRPWKEGADNGGKTYRGVTADTVKVVAYVAPNDVQLNPPGGGQPPRNRSTGTSGIIQDAILDSQTALDGRYENYGRKIEWSFVTYSGTDEASQRAGAVRVAELEPFAVVASTGGNVFVTEMAAKKIVVAFGGAGTQEDNLAQQPYRWTGQDADLHARPTSPSGSAPRWPARRRSTPATPGSRSRPAPSVSSTRRRRAAATSSTSTTSTSSSRRTASRNRS